jgi:hypothetical protein
VYFVRYVDPKFAGREEPNFFARMFTFGKKDDGGGLAKYRVKVTAEGSASTVAVLDSQGKPERAKRQADRRPASRRPEVSSRAQARRHVIRFRSLGSGQRRQRHRRRGDERDHDDAPARRRRLLAQGARHAAGRWPASPPSTSMPVFVTHEHGDHIGCALTLAERERLPLWMSRGTWRATGGFAAPANLRFARDDEPIAIGDIEVHPFTVAHDAAEPLQLRCSDGGSCWSCSPTSVRSRRT